MTEQEIVAAFAAEHDELEAWREVGARLWTFIRPWGLCGAHPDAINAAADMAALLGIQAENQVDANVELLTRKRTIKEVVELFEQDWFRKMMRKDADAFVQELESL